MLYLAADHGGFALKEKIKEHLKETGVSFEDMGAHELDEKDDYPDFAHAAAEKVAENPENNRAVLLCKSGVGVAIVANKVKGVYCAQVFSRAMAKKAKEHDLVNAIALGANYIEENEALAAVDEFIKETKGDIEERHLRRFKKVKKIEGRAV